MNNRTTTAPRRASRHTRVTAGLAGLAILATACGGDDDAVSEGVTAPAGPTAEGSTARTSPADGDPYVIGWMGDLSGPTAVTGAPDVAGLRTYIHEVNAAGGVHGRQIDLRVLDEGVDVARGQSNFNEFLEEGALAVLSMSLSNVAVAIAPIAEREQLPFLNYGLPAIPEEQYVFLDDIAIVDAGSVQVAYVERLLKEAGTLPGKVAVISIDTATGAAYRERLEAEFQEAGIEISTSQVFPLDSADFQTPAAQVANAGADYVVMFLIDSLVPGVVNALRQQGVDEPLINLHTGAANGVFEQLADPDFIAFRVFVDPSETDIPAVEAMRATAESAGEAGDMTNNYFTGGYLKGRLLVEALEECGPDCTREGLATALETIGEVETEGLAGPMGFAPDDHGLMNSARPYAWDDDAGRAVPIDEFIVVE